MQESHATHVEMRRLPQGRPDHEPAHAVAHEIDRPRDCLQRLPQPPPLDPQRRAPGILIAPDRTRPDRGFDTPPQHPPPPVRPPDAVENQGRHGGMFSDHASLRQDGTGRTRAPMVLGKRDCHLSRRSNPSGFILAMSPMTSAASTGFSALRPNDPRATRQSARLSHHNRLHVLTIS